MADESELDRIDPEPTIVKLESGFAVEVVRMKTRQMFRLLRILTRGAGPAITQLDFGGDGEKFGSQLFGIVVMAIPDAEQETISFLQSMCKPHGLVEKKNSQMTKAENDDNAHLFERFNEELFNPELEDTIALLEAIVANEAPELQSLGKKLSHLWTVARKASGFGERPEKTPEAEDLHLPEATHGSSTSSATSTDGPTSTSLTSPSADSGSARKRRQTAAVSSS